MSFFDFEGILFNRNHIQVVSGLTVKEEDLPALKEGKLFEPYFRVVLQDKAEWHITAQNIEELMKKREAFVTALQG